jgi:serine O-acetyltransferase
MNILWKIANKLYKFRGGKVAAHIFEILSYILCTNAISAKASIGRGTKFHHHGIGCVVHPNTVIGNDCNIFQNVTLGSKWPNGVCESGAPNVGDNVFIGAGAVVIGSVKIGNNSIIGANAVVITDVPENSIALGVPATITRRK